MRITIEIEAFELMALLEEQAPETTETRDGAEAAPAPPEADEGRVTEDAGRTEDERPVRKARPENSGRRKRPVEVLTDDGEWRAYGSVSAAAKSMGGMVNGLCTALKTGAAYKGREVRYAEDGPDGEDLPR